MKKGLLLINLGTPDNPDVKSTRRYLKEFLSDKRVIDLPIILRYALLYSIILPFRAPRASEAYASIWTKEGSPLRKFSNDLCSKVQKQITSEVVVALGMRYGNPSIKDALKTLEHCDELIILPLYPQYSQAATGSSIEYVLKIIQKKEVIPNLRIIRDFFDNEDFIKAEAQLIEPYIKNQEHILFSYHGLPEAHIQKAGCKKVCDGPCPNKNNQANAKSCYRAQCYKTTELIAKALNLAKDSYTTGFQSRLGKTKWIEPYTDELLSVLAAKGITKLAVVCPSFIADCLETLEEIGIRANDDWKKLTGQNLTLIPCLNSNQLLVDFILKVTT